MLGLVHSRPGTLAEHLHKLIPGNRLHRHSREIINPEIDPWKRKGDEERKKWDS